MEKLPQKKLFSERLRACRQRMGLKSAAMASLLGVSPPVYSRYEHGRIPASDVVAVIADKCEVTVDYLLGRSESQYPQGSERRIGSFVARESLALRKVPTEKIEEDVRRSVEILPSAPPGRARIAILTEAINSLVELRERCADEWTGKKRDQCGIREDATDEDDS